MTEKRKDSQTQEALEEIRKAEKKAHRIIIKSKEETSYSIIQKAHKDAGDIKEKILTDARKKAQAAQSEITGNASDDVAKIRQEAKNEIASLNKTAEGTRADAAAKTNKKILEIIKKESW